jgi:DNA-binding transcriptional ArsR family regulator
MIVSAKHASTMPFTDPIYVLKSDFFRVLGHPARVRILELLRDGERSVGDLQAALTLDSSGTSQHLSALRRHGLLESRRERTNVYYRVRDARLFQLLELAREILTSSLADTQSLLSGLQDSAPAPAPASRPRSR